jgi:lysophospholipase
VKRIALFTFVLAASFELFWGNTMSYAQPLSIENELNSAESQKIEAHWARGNYLSFLGKNNVRIHYASFTQDSHKKRIILVPGRSEGYLKYKELSFDLFNQGYDLHIIDHRGQGISERITADPHKGFVNQFDDYSEDLNQFVTLTSQESDKKTFLLAHSMGGAISSRYLQQYDHNIAAAVLASPMIAVSSGGIPTWLAHGIINGGSKLNNMFSDTPWYFLGQGKYASTPFEQNQLTHSEIRYQIFKDLYQQTPELQLGGVTFQWLAQAIQANKDIFTNIDKLTVPILVLQSGSDTIVDNQAQDDFCQVLHQVNQSSCPDGKALKIEGAFHELFFEQDKYRQPAIEQVIKWFESY